MDLYTLALLAQFEQLTPDEQKAWDEYLIVQRAELEVDTGQGKLVSAAFATDGNFIPRVLKLLK
jgi:hypothetical protein